MSPPTDPANTTTNANAGTSADANPDAVEGSHRAERPAPAARSGNSFAGDWWVNFKRWNLKAVRNPFVLVVSLVQPVIFLVLFTQVFGQVATGAIHEGGAAITYETYLVPAIAVQVSLAAAATSGVGLVNDIENGMFEKVLVTPMNRAVVFLGKTAAEILRILIQIGIILVLGVLLGAEIATGVAGALGVMLVGVVFSMWFVSLSNTIAILTRDQESTIIGANLLQFPLLFVSTAFLPLRVLPEWIQFVATYNPITYGVDAARALMLGRDVMTVIEVTAFPATVAGVEFGALWNTLLPGLAVLVALDLALGSVAVYMLSRASSSDVR